MCADMRLKLWASAPDANHSPCARWLGAHGERDAYQAPDTRGEMGRSSRNEKRVPLPSSVSTSSSPPIAWTSCWQMERPSPELENAYSLRLARCRKGSNSVGSASG